MIAREFSRYRLLSCIGEGGMGQVYLAEDPSLGRKIALKFIRPGAAPDDSARRLLREARAAAQLDHPFLCKVYEAGEYETTPYIALEFVEGVTLKHRLESGGPLPQRDALRIAAEIAEAVQFAHAAGIVHRDLKPSNIMIGVDGHVKVMDFGVAKRLGVPIAADAVTVKAATATLPGNLTGTLAYMAPEQIRGEPADARSDIFAFGIILHELLTGRHPFMQASGLETAHAILTEPAPALEPPADGSSPLLAHIVDRCLQKDRARRYQSLSDVRIELDTLTAGTTPAAPPRRVTRRWITAASIAAVALVLAALQWFRPGSLVAPESALAFKERDWLVITDVNNLTGDPVFDRSLSMALEVTMAQSQYVNVYPRERVVATFRRMHRSESDALNEATAVEVARREQVRGVLTCGISQLGNTYSITARLIDPQTGAAVLTDAVKANGRDQVLDALDRLTSRLRSRLGESLAQMSQQARPLPAVTTSSLEALQLYAKSFAKKSVDDNARDELLRQAITLDPDFALAHAELGNRYYMSSSSDVRKQGEQHIAKALSLTHRLTLRERLWLQAVSDDSRGNRERAVDAYKTYLAQYPDDGRALFRLGWTQMATLGQFSEAAENFKRVTTLDPSDASAHVNLATAYRGLNNFPAAVAEYQKAFELSPELLFGLFINHEYGFTLVSMGKVTEARKVFQRMQTEAPAGARARGFRSMAFLEMYIGRYGAAIQQIRQAIALNRAAQQTVSEYRDRLILITALQASGRSHETTAEWIALRKLADTLTLGPEWLWRPAMLLARTGHPADAARFVTLMGTTTQKATADSSTNRVLSHDAAYVNLAQGAIELATRRTEVAVETVTRAHGVLNGPDSLESLAYTLAIAGRPADAIARYEKLNSDPPLGNEAQEFWFSAQLALAGLYERTGRPADAQRLYTAFIDRWKDGDQDLPLLLVARKRLARVEASR
jgi:serine/threonine protein kinase/tetratricopeptide (TPR) repeat protein